MSDDERPTGPLSDVNVLDLSRFVPGALCTLLLADLGADVVKVEAPALGDGNRGPRGTNGFETAHIALNRGKRSVALDLKHEGAASVLSRLVGWADVVVESHRPGQLDAFGLGYEAMSIEHPEVVWCSVTGFGDDGPHADAPGHDLLYVAYAGLLARLSAVEPTPPRTVLAAPFAATTATTGILAALLEARRTGRGTRLGVNMTDSTMWALSEEVARAANHAGPGYARYAALDVYRCADDRAVVVCAMEPRTWAILCDALAAPDLAGRRFDPRGEGDEDAVRARLAELFARKPSSHWIAHPGLAGGVGPVNDVEDLADDPQVTERGSLIPLAGTDVRVLANPIRFAGADGAEASHAPQPPPPLGADTDDVLTAVGFTADEIAALRAAGSFG